MNQYAINHMKQVGQAIINASDKLGNRVVNWETLFASDPGSPNIGSVAGFTTDWRRECPIATVVEVSLPPGQRRAILRTQLIHTSIDEQGNEHFNQITLSFSARQSEVERLVGMKDKITRQNILLLLNEDETALFFVTVSNDTGRDIANDRLFGTRTSYTDDQIETLQADEIDKLISEIDTVLPRLERAVETITETE